MNFRTLIVIALLLAAIVLIPFTSAANRTTDQAYYLTHAETLAGQKDMSRYSDTPEPEPLQTMNESTARLYPNVIWCGNDCMVPKPCSFPFIQCKSPLTVMIVYNVRGTNPGYPGPVVGYRMSGRKGKNQLQWIEGGHAYAITGMLDEAEMVRMATSLAHMDYRLMATIPVNQPKTAQPLTISELTSIIMPESWVRSHNNSTTPGIIDIRLPAREFDETFSRSTQYPDFLVYHNISPDQQVVLYQIPKTMFAADNPDPAQVVMNLPESMFRYYPDLNAVFLDRCRYDRIPCPPGGAQGNA
ncbi:MAG: hypothetical protein ABSB80_00330 [Methanoregula sp.]|jgi:hypothetical protein|uniref:hypothetical protein n=1 Tax=Methanoregula sp. TaxID=2052170 RepID=UPI003D0CFD11